MRKYWFIIIAGIFSIFFTTCNLDNVIGSYTSPTAGHIASIEIVGNYAYVGEWNYGIRILDISDPSSITLAGTYEMTLDSGMDHELRVSGDGDYLFVAAHSECLTVLDISDIAGPVEVDSHALTGCSASGVDLEGDYAFYADGVNGLVVLDISDPEDITLCDDLDDGTYLDQVYDVDAVGDYAYTISRVGQFAVVDVSNVYDISVLGSNENINALTEEIVVEGDYAYIADNLGSLKIFDISDPNSPSYLSSLNITMSAESLCIADGYVYVLDATQNTVYKVDVSDPYNPESVDSWDFDNIIDDICVSDDILYVSGKDGLFEAIQL